MKYLQNLLVNLALFGLALLFVFYLAPGAVRAVYNIFSALIGRGMVIVVLVLLLLVSALPNRQ